VVCSDHSRSPWQIMDTSTNDRMGGKSMKKTRVSFLDNGTMALPDFKLFWGRGTGELVRFSSYAVLVDHDDGLFLFDTGYDHRFMEVYTPQDNAIAAPDQAVVPQLAKLGIEPGDIDYLVQSHFHIDHVGGNKYFPDATLVVHKKEYEAAKNPAPFEYQSYSDLSFDPELHRLNFIGSRDILKRTGTADEEPAVSRSPKYEFVESDTELAEGLRLYEIPGHSAGQMAMMVDIPRRRPMFFPADACHLPKHLEEMIVPNFHIDPLAAYRSIERVKALEAEYDAEIFWGHPPGDSLPYHKAPEWYE
jgi:4-pyridoxolactonase